MMILTRGTHSSLAWMIVYNSTFPHGGMISTGLLLATGAALAATTYSVVSCRLVVLSFISNTGNFEDSFSRFTQINQEDFTQYKVALGLFQWLRPNGDDANWDDGTCVGYQQSMKDHFAETDFEIARGFGSIAVLLSVITFLWAGINSCIAWNVWQIIILAFLLLSGTFACGMTFMFFRSDLCNSVFPESTCRIDEGGLILVAGSILWFAGFLITVLFIRPLDRLADERGLSPMDRNRAREAAATKEARAREKERRRLEKQKEKQRTDKNNIYAPSAVEFEEEDGGIAVTPMTAASYTYSEDEESAEKNTRKKRKPRAKSSQRNNGRADEDYQVYVNSRNRRVDEILRDIQTSEDRQQSAI